MQNMILIDLETQDFSVDSGIYEVAALVVENWVIKDKFYLGIVDDETEIHSGYGYGYRDISRNQSCIEKFKIFIEQYNYPLVAHNGSFDRKFLVYYGWISEDYPFFDSIRAIKYTNSKLFSYSMEHLIDFLDTGKSQTHTAMSDIEILYDILNFFRPDRWIPIGLSGSHGKNLTAIKQDFEVIQNLFAGRNIVFTGKGPYTRNELMELAKKCGADITSDNITKKTNLLVVGEDAGSKLKKAQDLGIEIISIDDFYYIVEGVTLDEKQQVKIDKLISKECAILSDKLKGQSITLFPMKIGVANKAATIVEQHGGTPLFALRKKETNLLVYQPYAEDLITVQKAKQLGISTMTLGKFNKYLLELEKYNEE